MRNGARNAVFYRQFYKISKKIGGGRTSNKRINYRKYEKQPNGRSKQHHGAEAPRGCSSGEHFMHVTSARGCGRDRKKELMGRKCGSIGAKGVGTRPPLPPSADRRPTCSQSAVGHFTHADAAQPPTSLLCVHLFPWVSVVAMAAPLIADSRL